MTSANGHSRTRTRLIEAFNQLVFAKTPPPIRVGQIIAQAGVGRSTFYDHFPNAEAVHMAALSRPLGPLADALAGLAPASSAIWLLDHFHANRGRARDTIAGPDRERVARLLAQMLDARLQPNGQLQIPRRLALAQIAEAALAPIRQWLCAEAAVSSQALGESITTTAAAMRQSLGFEPIKRAASESRRN